MLVTTGTSAPAPLPQVIPQVVSSSSFVSASTISLNPAAIRNRGTVMSIIFTKDCPTSIVQFTLPRPDERLISTRQLAFCLALMRNTVLPLDSLNASTRAWLTATEKNQDEKDRLRTMAIDIIRTLVRDELKDTKAINEVVCLAPVLDRADFRALLSMLVNMINNPLLLDVQALEGLMHMIQAAPAFIKADDLVKILNLLSTRLQETFQQSPQHIYRLTMAVSRILDTMADSLRGADTLIQNGELTKFKTLVCEAPCCHDLAIQWGVCQRLGYLAADPVWDDVSPKDAIAFLGEMYWNDEKWSQKSPIKQYVLDILLRLSHSTCQGRCFCILVAGSMHSVVRILLKDLSTDGDENKRNLYQSCIQMGRSEHTWNVPSPHLDSSFLIDLVQSKPSIEPVLRKYQRHRPRTSHDNDLFDPATRVNEYLLEVNSKVLLLLGDSGAGKSTFNLELEKSLWTAYDIDKKWVPLFITPAINTPEEDLIGKHLLKYDFTNGQILERKSYHQIILICDGYDECTKMNNLYNDNRLNQPGGWNVKMLISCRSEYLGSGYRIFFEPGNRNDRKGAAQLQEAVIAPFSLAKIDSYTKAMRIPNIQDLVRNPFLLSLALEVLPRLVDLSKELTSNQISRVMLYDQFVEQWVERGQKRFSERSVPETMPVAVKDLLKDGFKQNAIRFMKRLAAAIFDYQDGRPIVEFSPIRDNTTWKTVFFGHGDVTDLLRETCPLSSTGNHYRFIHRSVLVEYALARAVFEPGQPEADDQNPVEKLGVQ
ncbi:Transducin (beta)-like 1 X-linked receptor 1 [Linnemannia zychae]|nr:Transducin (beta)-like 1 X-linked receptor 1 [Linnemannia zychae]